ncbi:MAG: pyridoxamine 5'-phosphate oxidase family protein [Pseudomonadota bacterium]
MARAFAEIAFTEAVREMQERQGSAAMNDRMLADDVERGEKIGPDEAAFIAARDGFYQATVGATGWSYVQFHGGPRGFLKVLDERRLAYADFRGNRQYVSAGNLAGDGRVALFLMDYPSRARLKIWGRAHLVPAEEDIALIGDLYTPSYRAHPERAVVIEVAAFDWNCPQHIPQRLTLEEMAPHLQPMRDEIARLKKENAELRHGLST